MILIADDFIHAKKERFSRRLLFRCILLHCSHLAHLQFGHMPSCPYCLTKYNACNRHMRLTTIFYSTGWAICNTMEIAVKCVHLHIWHHTDFVCSLCVHIYISTQKQPGFQNGTALYNMASVKKLWNQRGQPRNGCDDIGWWQKIQSQKFRSICVASSQIQKKVWPCTKWPSCEI